eukprot:TCALIF_10658-PA protein Name:"Similar to resilin Pro-resilin (Drosophila melanogaster)" AED:0.40 eAED:0.40 QI:0/0/0/0.5/1/1/2/0/114
MTESNRAYIFGVIATLAFFFGIVRASYGAGHGGHGGHGGGDGGGGGGGGGGGYYSFGYKVNDGYNNFGHSESRNGGSTKGQYHVKLPDGKLQTVNYHVDGYSGYVAKVNNGYRR